MIVMLAIFLFLNTLNKQGITNGPHSVIPVSSVLFLQISNIPHLAVVNDFRLYPFFFCYDNPLSTDVCHLPLS
jgi:hypothetical protein